MSNEVQTAGWCFVEPRCVKIELMSDVELVELGAAITQRRKPRPGKGEYMAKKLAELGHWSVVEHWVVTARFVCSRNVSHQFVRHRLASYSERSTLRGHLDTLEFVRPWWWWNATPKQRKVYAEGLDEAAKRFERARQTLGKIPARDLLPGGLATELLVTANVREWNHIYRLRHRPPAHPEFVRLMASFLMECRKVNPVLADVLQI